MNRPALELFLAMDELTRELILRLATQGLRDELEDGFIGLEAEYGADYLFTLLHGLEEWGAHAD